MAVRDFKQIAGLDARAAMAGIAGAGDLFKAGTQSLMGALDDRRQVIDKGIERETAANDAAIQANLAKLNTLGGLREAEATGQFGEAALNRQFGSRYNKDAVEGVMADTKTKLREQAYNDLLGAGQAAARETNDISAGAETIRQGMLQKGATPQEAASRAESFMNQSKVLQASMAAQEEEATDTYLSGIKDLPKSNEGIAQAVSNAPVGVDKDALRTMLAQRLAGSRADKEQLQKDATAKGQLAAHTYAQASLAGDADPATLRAAATKDMSPEELRAFDNNVVKEQNSLAELSTISREDLGTAVSTLGNQETQMRAANQAAFKAEQDRINATKDPMRQQSIAFFGEEGIKNFSTVIDRITSEDSWLTGEHKGELAKLHRNLMEDNKMSSAEASSILGDAYLSTKAANDSIWGQRINPEAMGVAIKNSLDQINTLNKAQADLSKAQIKEEQRKGNAEVALAKATSDYKKKLRAFERGELKTKPVPPKYSDLNYKVPSFNQSILDTTTTAFSNQFDSGAGEEAPPEELPAQPGVAENIATLDKAAGKRVSRSPIAAAPSITSRGVDPRVKAVLEKIEGAFDKEQLRAEQAARRKLVNKAAYQQGSK